MRTKERTFLGMAVVAAGLVSVGSATAQGAASATHMHVGHVADAFRDTPDGKGLLPTAVAEAEVVAQHARLMAGSTDNLDGMKTHAGHVIHAIDPTEVTNGPGRGYGLTRAAEAAVTHIEMAANADGASQNVKTHSVHVATSTRNTIARAEEILSLARQVREAASAADAAPLVQQLQTLASQLLPGVDADGDGRVGWAEGEGGLEVAVTHMGLLKTGEGLP